VGGVLTAIKKDDIMSRYYSLIAAVIASLVLVLESAYSEGIDPVTQAAANRVAIGTCASCHGPHGQSILPKYPVLAGQHANYLAAQLHAFRDKTRGDPDALGYMWGMASRLDDDAIAALAEYYSRQTPRAGPTIAGKLIDEGKNIYLNGDVAKGIPACAACHGAHAEGNDSFPRLAGQHAQYLVKQLRSFRSNLRNVAVMHGVARGLELGEMSAVATYLQSLGAPTPAH
jgi:cytochrome c553